MVIAVIIPSQRWKLGDGAEDWDRGKDSGEWLRRGCGEAGNGEASAEACSGQQRRPRPKHEDGDGVVLLMIDEENHRSKAHNVIGSSAEWLPEEALEVQATINFCVDANMSVIYYALATY